MAIIVIETTQPISCNIYIPFAHKTVTFKYDDEGNTQYMKLGNS